MNTRLGLVFLGISLALAACGGGSNTSTNAAPLTLAETCTGLLSCQFNGALTSVPLHREDGACMLGPSTLGADGTVDAATNDGSTWASSPSQLSVCASDGCIVCAPVGAAPTAPTAAANTPDNLIRDCSARVHCTLGDFTEASRLTKDGAGCHLGGLTLLPGGGTKAWNDGDPNAAHDISFTWDANATTLTMSANGRVTMACVAVGGPAPNNTGATASKCTGTATSCGAASSCNTQAGCWLNEESAFYTDTFYYYSTCEGSATACDELTEPTSCAKQSGCSWK